MTEIESLQLFKDLTKDGCEWQGDVFSKKWSEVLFATSPHVEEKVKRTLSHYTEGTDYKREGSAIWIA